MKILTLISSIILPLTFITGIFGMNVVFPFIPEGSTVALWIIVGVMAVMGVGLTLIFRHRKWWL